MQVLVRINDDNEELFDFETKELIEIGQKYIEVIESYMGEEFIKTYLPENVPVSYIPEEDEPYISKSDE